MRRASRMDQFDCAASLALWPSRVGDDPAFGASLIYKAKDAIWHGSSQGQVERIIVCRSQLRDL